MKICKICNSEKDDKEFSNGKYQTVKTCRSCRRLIQNNNRQNNLLSQREKDKISYQKTKHKRVQYAKDYRIKYPERTALLLITNP